MHGHNRSSRDVVAPPVANRGATTRISEMILFPETPKALADRSVSMVAEADVNLRAMRPAIVVERLSKFFPRPGGRSSEGRQQGDLRSDTGGALVLDDVSFAVPQGSLFCVYGRSGSGKSTLLNLLAGIDLPSSGTVACNGHTLNGMSEDDRTCWRARTVGMVYEFVGLLPTLSAGENVRLALQLARCVPRNRWSDQVSSVLRTVGMEDAEGSMPKDLAAGEQQRVAIARAIVNEPSILLADEPTGRLTTQEMEVAMGLLTGLSKAGLTVLIATHDRDIADRATERVELRDGRVSDRSYGAIPEIYSS